MNDKKLLKIIQAALFTALVFVATYIIRIPTIGGYIHPGDAMVILSGIFLGPLYGFLAAGIGSALADLIAGYLIYAPGTFIIKALIALIAALLYKNLSTKTKPVIPVILGGVTDIVLVAVGYLLYEIPMYQAGALANVVPNIIQGASGLVISLLLYPVINKIIKTINK